MELSKGNIKITFDKSAKKEILSAFNKSVKDDFIVEKENPNQKIHAFDGQELTLEQFAGIQKGSEIFIKRDLCSLMKYCKMLE